MSAADLAPAASAPDLHAVPRRLLDIGVGLFLLMLWTPLMMPALLVALLQGGPAWRRETRVGRGGRRFDLFCINLRPDSAALLRRLGADRAPRWLALVSGAMSLVGPRAIAPDEEAEFLAAAPARFDVRPGLVCIWWLRRRSNMDFGTEAQADLEYIATRSLRRDLGLLARAEFSALYGKPAAGHEAVTHISGIRLLNLGLDDVLNAISAALRAGLVTRIAFVNPDCVNIAARDARYRATLAEFDWVCADGIGMKIAGNMLGRPIRQNVNGTDLFPRLCADLAASGDSLYLLGARPGVAAAAARWAVDHYPGLRIAGARSGYFAPGEEQQAIAAIRASGARVLLVALGAPRQEQWIRAHLDASGAVVAMGVGGLFDFYSGRISRAPLWLREIGGEWVYRLLQEPGRMWKRYLVGNGLFLLRVLRERLREKLGFGTRPDDRNNDDR